MKFMLIAFIMAVFLAGCGNNEVGRGDESQLALIKATNPEPVKLSAVKEKSIAGKVKEDIRKIDELYDVAVVERKKEVLVAYKVKHLARFRMKKIESDMKEKLEKKYKDYTFTVSSDYKIFLEAVRLKEDIRSGKITKKQANQRFEKILKLQKELT